MLKLYRDPPLDMPTIPYFTVAEIEGSNVPYLICEGKPPLLGIGHTSPKTAFPGVAPVRRLVPLGNP